MKTNWQLYTPKHFKKLQGKQVKLNNGTVKTVSMIVGASLFDRSNNKIETDDILCFAEKVDMSRFHKLQKHYEILLKYDNDTLNDLAWAIEDTTGVDLTELFVSLSENIDSAQTKCLNESKKYL